MFAGAESFNQNVGLWDVPSAKVKDSMIDEAMSFNQVIGSWDVSHVTTMKCMFRDALALKKDIGCWDVCPVWKKQKECFQEQDCSTKISKTVMSPVSS